MKDKFKIKNNDYYDDYAQNTSYKK
jgi:hypothetical protein